MFTCTYCNRSAYHALDEICERTKVETPTYKRIISNKTFMRKVSGQAAEGLINRAEKLKKRADKGESVSVEDIFLTGDYNNWISAYDR